jgi:sialate O-acetylesterase
MTSLASWRLRAAASATLLAMLCATAGSAQQARPPAVPQFADVFGTGMVLPHGVPIELRGQSAPNQRLRLKVGDDEYSVRSDARGAWRQQVKPLRAGGPYTLAIQDDRGGSTELTEVLAGEVWLCSGQSNMEFSAGMSTDQPAEAMQGNDAIRLLSVAHQTALQARETFADKPVWMPAGPQQVRNFSALCYFFARGRLAGQGVPIGLVNASWGGSAIEAWISEQQLAALPSYRRPVELLRQYRDNQRKSEVAFAGDWANWWQASSTMGPVWQQGVLDANPDWRAAPLQDWRSYPDPRLKSFTGNLWFSTSFTLSEAQSRKGASFVLGKIDEVDTTWLNGRFVGNTFGYGTRREYRLEPGLLQAGTNQFSVFVTNTYDAGGMTGPESDVGIRFDDGEFVSLGSTWKYRLVPKETGYPPRAPWESVAGVSGMFNGMIAPLRPLAPTGVIWYQGESNADKAGAYEQLLTGLISDWRRHFGPKLPFIVVQLPNYGAIASSPGESGWATLRNAQQQVAVRDERVGLVAIQDLGNDADIHPRQKFAVATRALQVARALEGSGPEDGVVPQLIDVKPDAVVIGFSPPLPANSSSNRAAGFILCGTQARGCVATDAVQHGSRIEVSRSAMPDATRLRYCWSDGGSCQLRSLGGLPVGSFELPLTHPGK